MNVRTRENLTSQALAYISAGVFLTSSHYVNKNILLLYTGHVLIAVSFLILLSLLISELFSSKPLLRNINRRISTALDSLFAQILPITTVASLIFRIYSEIDYLSTPEKPYSPSSGEINLWVIIGVIVIALVLYVFASLAPIVKRRWWIIILFVFGLAAFILSVTFKVLPLYCFGIALGVILLVILIFRLKKMSELKKDHIPTSPPFTYAIFSFLLVIVFFIASILSNFIGAIPSVDFWGIGFCLIFLMIAFLLNLHFWRHYFPLAFSLLTKSVFLFFLTGILYISSKLFVVSFINSSLLIQVTWIVCVLVSFSSEIESLFHLLMSHIRVFSDPST
jgi:hypothetical protein